MAYEQAADAYRQDKSPLNAAKHFETLGVRQSCALRLSGTSNIGATFAGDDAGLEEVHRCGRGISKGEHVLHGGACLFHTGRVPFARSLQNALGGPESGNG